MDNSNLERRVEALEKWQKDRQRQQIVYPLDFQSIIILNKYFMHIISTLEYDAGVGDNHFVQYLGQQNDILFAVNPPTLTGYTANPSTDFLSTTGGNERFFDGNAVVLYTDGTAPDPLFAQGLITYYIRDSDDSNSSFKLTDTPGGVAIDILDAGSGRQFIEKL